MIEYAFWITVLFLGVAIFFYLTFLMVTLVGWLVFGYREPFDGLTCYLFYKPLQLKEGEKTYQTSTRSKKTHTATAKFPNPK